MMEYSVAIRTLGTAAEKYQSLLNSLKAQTVQPKDIYVYIAEGFDLPKETIGMEKYIRTPKGMVTQRSMPFDEIETEYILFCDDDLYLPPSLVEDMFCALKKENGDCICPDMTNYKASTKDRVLSFAHSFTLPHFSRKWDVKVHSSGSFAYRIMKGKKVMPTQSAAFACLLCRKDAFKAVHFEDERWLDRFRYASCDDQLFYFKLHLYGYKVFTYNDSGMVHLDARAGGRHDVSEKLYNQKKIAFVIWYRTIYQPSHSLGRKIKGVVSYAMKFMTGVLFLPLEVVYYRQLRYFRDYFRAIVDGYRYVHSEDYLKIPPYDFYKKPWK